MVFSRKAIIDTLRTLANGSISAGYAAVGTAMTHPVRILRLVNNTNGDMLFSTDGTTDMFFVAKTSFVLYDLSSNGNPQQGFSPFAIAKGTQIYVKQSTAPSSGSVYVEVVYASGE